MVEVVAGLIWKEGKFMICQRPENKARELMWEFVGGKVEKGESREDALVRECKEELDVTVKPLDVFCTVDHVYPDITIRLILFNAEIVEGEPKMLEHNDLKWITAEEIDNYQFCPADKEILERIKCSTAR
jgi:8-oxo-dGTP diphosphatase